MAQVTRSRNRRRFLTNRSSRNKRGGSLSEGLALYLRDHGEPLPVLTVLNCPVLTPALTESKIMFGGLGAPAENYAKEFESIYLKPNGLPYSYYAMPSFCPDLRGLGAHMMFLLVALACVMMLQIVMRFGFHHALPWPEEFCRYCFLYSIMLATSYCIRTERMLKVDAVVSLLPRKAVKVIDIISKIMAMMFCIILIYPSYRVMIGTKIGRHWQVSPSMQIPISLFRCSCCLALSWQQADSRKRLYNELCMKKKYRRTVSWKKEIGKTENQQ